MGQEKKNPAHFTIAFNPLIPSHQKAIDVLSQMGRNKAHHIAEALEFYHNFHDQLIENAGVCFTPAASQPVNVPQMPQTVPVAAQEPFQMDLATIAQQNAANGNLAKIEPQRGNTEPVEERETVAMPKIAPETVEESVEVSERVPETYAESDEAEETESAPNSSIDDLDESDLNMIMANMDFLDGMADD